MAVFVLDKNHHPLMPCTEKRARLLLDRGRARIHRLTPFVIRLVDRMVKASTLQPVAIKLDPGSKITGMAIVRKSAEVDRTSKLSFLPHVITVLFLLELTHRGHVIQEAMGARKRHRCFRRSKLRYRPARFDNRTRKPDWLPPSLGHRLDTTLSWVTRLRRWCPITRAVIEQANFDTQLMQDAEISGVAYQQGTLAGYSVREYLLAKWGRKCAYCDASHVQLQIDHITPRSRGGSDRVSNLTLACQTCNQSKGAQSVTEFLANQPKRLANIQFQQKVSLKDAAAVNTTRNAIVARCAQLGLPVETSTGAQTKYNRQRLDIPKTHALDAACTGDVDDVRGWNIFTLKIAAMGRGRYQRAKLNRYGFARGHALRTKRVHGFQTGDLVKAVVPKGKHKGTYVGRVAVRATGSFNLDSTTGVRQGISHKHLTLLQRADGYRYVR